LSITGNNNGAGFYPFFYDWEVQLPPCTSERIPIFPIMLPTPVASYSQVTNIDTTLFTDLSTVEPEGYGILVILHSGTADTSTVQNPVHIFFGDRRCLFRVPYSK
jgi:PKD repeat protein